MRRLFKRTVRTAVAMQLVDLAVQAVDGTKVAANATRDRTYDAERGRRLLDRLEQAIEDLEAQNEGGEDAPAVYLPEELADKRALREQVRQAMDDLASQEGLRHINLTDKDARLMKTRHGIVPGYNAQSMVSPTEVDDEASGMLITAVDVVDDPTDYGQFTPMLEQAEETTGTKSQMTLADAGYFAASHLAECDRRGQQVVVSEARQRFLKDPYHKDQFTYNEPSDSFTCPQGQTLKFIRIQHTNGVPLRLYRASEAVCQVCPAFGVCTRAKEIGRSLAIGPHDAVLRRHRAWMSTSAAREAYKLRKQLVEPVFGIIKEQQGARRFLLRGLVNVAAEWTMLATAFNLRTLWRAWRSSPFIQLPHGPNLHPAS
jgi:transposase